MLSVKYLAPFFFFFGGMFFFFFFLGRGVEEDSSRTVLTDRKEYKDDIRGEGESEGGFERIREKKGEESCFIATLKRKQITKHKSSNNNSEQRFITKIIVFFLEVFPPSFWEMGEVRGKRGGFLERSL